MCKHFLLSMYLLRHRKKNIISSLNEVSFINKPANLIYKKPEFLVITENKNYVNIISFKSYIKPQITNRCIIL